jgi:hypothetical protein
MPHDAIVQQFILIVGHDKLDIVPMILLDDVLELILMPCLLWFGAIFGKNKPTFYSCNNNSIVGSSIFFYSRVIPDYQWHVSVGILLNQSTSCVMILAGLGGLIP